MKIPFTKAWREAGKNKAAQIEAENTKRQEAKLNELKEVLLGHIAAHEDIGFKFVTKASWPLCLSSIGVTCISPSGKAYRLTAHPSGGYNLASI